MFSHITWDIGLPLWKALDHFVLKHHIPGRFTQASYPIVTDRGCCHRRMTHMPGYSLSEIGYGRHYSRGRRFEQCLLLFYAMMLWKQYQFDTAGAFTFLCYDAMKTISIWHCSGFYFICYENNTNLMLCKTIQSDDIKTINLMLCFKLSYDNNPVRLR